MEGPSLYDTDILAWSEQQAAALRAMAARRDLPNALDLGSVIEEIEALGRSELKAVTSPMRLILEHLVKPATVPDALSVPHWRDQILHWHRDILDSIAPSMDQKIRLELLWRQARRDAERSLAGHGDIPHPALPDACPLGLSDFQAEDSDLDAAIARIRAAAA